MLQSLQKHPARNILHQKHRHSSQLHHFAGVFLSRAQRNFTPLQHCSKSTVLFNVTIPGVPVADSEISQIFSFEGPLPCSEPYCSWYMPLWNSHTSISTTRTGPCQNKSRTLVSVSDSISGVTLGPGYPTSSISTSWELACRGGPTFNDSFTLRATSLNDTGSLSLFWTGACSSLVSRQAPLLRKFRAFCLPPKNSAGWISRMPGTVESHPYFSTRTIPPALSGAKTRSPAANPFPTTENQSLSHGNQ